MAASVTVPETFPGRDLRRSSITSVSPTVTTTDRTASAKPSRRATTKWLPEASGPEQNPPRVSLRASATGTPSASKNLTEASTRGSPVSAETTVPRMKPKLGSSSMVKTVVWPAATVNPTVAGA